MALDLVLKNGTETGATVADKINAAITLLNDNNLEGLDTILTGIQADIAALETKDTSLDADIAALNTALADKINIVDTGILSLVNNSGSNHNLTTTFQTIDFAATVSVSVPNGAFTHDPINDKVTVNKTGVYRLSASGAMEAPSNSEISFDYAINGAVSSSYPIFQGAGAGKPVAIGDVRIITLTAGDTVEVQAKADANITMTLVASSLSIEKTHY